jgi:phage host-nuclease inhibitor protein Gam
MSIGLGDSVHFWNANGNLELGQVEWLEKKSVAVRKQDGKLQVMSLGNIQEVRLKQEASKEAVQR